MPDADDFDVEFFRKLMRRGDSRAEGKPQPQKAAAKRAAAAKATKAPAGECGKAPSKGKRKPAPGGAPSPRTLRAKGAAPLRTTE